MYDDLQTLATACFQKFIFLIKMLPPNILKNELPTSVCVCVCVCVCVHVHTLSHVQLSVTPWTGDLQAPLSMEFPRQE